VTPLFDYLWEFERSNSYMDIVLKIWEFMIGSKKAEQFLRARDRGLGVSSFRDAAVDEFGTILLGPGNNFPEVEWQFTVRLVLVSYSRGESNGIHGPSRLAGHKIRGQRKLARRCSRIIPPR